MTTAQEFLAAAASEIGYTENPPGSNRTKFAAEAGHLNGYAWCMTFLNAIAVRTGLDLPPGVLTTAYTPAAAGDFKRAERWTLVPEVGAWAFFDFPDSKYRIQHVGVVEAIHPDGTVTCIEGNTASGTAGSQDNGGTVARRRRNASLVVGYGLPYYTPEPPKLTKEAHVLVREGSPEAALVKAYPNLFGLPVRVLALDEVRATDNSADVAFGLPVWGTPTQIRGRDRYETLRLALEHLNFLDLP